MEDSNEARDDQGSKVEAHLWQAVIVGAIQEWRTGTLRRQLEAEHYLFEDSKGLELVCHLAGLDAGRLRAKLAKLRPRTSRQPDQKRGHLVLGSRS
jgi:hypothetical protein